MAGTNNWKTKAKDWISLNASVFTQQFGLMR